MMWIIGLPLGPVFLLGTFFAASGGRWDFRVIQTNNNRATSNNTPNGGNPFASFLLAITNQMIAMAYSTFTRPILIAKRTNPATS